MNQRLIILWAFLLLMVPVHAQFEWPSLSPKTTLTHIIGFTEVSISYERPAARGRKIFGGLVPWNKVWRTGAGYCTKMSFSQPIILGGQKVEAGTYSLFTIPNPDHWVVILNADTQLYGAYDYEAAKDVVRFSVIPRPAPHFYESLSFDIDFVPNNAEIYLSWCDIQLSFSLETMTDQKVMQYIDEQLLTGLVTEPDDYAMAADYLVFQQGDMKKALRLADLGIERGGGGFPYRVKVDILADLGRIPEAIRTAEKALSLVPTYQNRSEEQKEGEVESWEKYLKELRQKK
ncbi:MAG: DUF2911 domain-containing protein [Bacteroidota bacterium]